VCPQGSSTSIPLSRAQHKKELPLHGDGLYFGHHHPFDPYTFRLRPQEEEAIGVLRTGGEDGDGLEALQKQFLFLSKTHVRVYLYLVTLSILGSLVSFLNYLIGLIHLD
jgi:hypothetical protein